ncbi:MAG: hypothetical protein HQM14_17335 [SAR324 cluster bacterium]|nr:hypothetical protein [SAR324 cluster bacterium]
MQDLRFFDDLESYFRSLPQYISLKQYFDSPAFSSYFPDNHVLYSRLLSRLLDILDIPHTSASCYKELSSLYRLFDRIDPYYFTEDQISQEITKCYTLAPLQQKRLLAFAITFFHTMRKLSSVTEINIQWEQCDGEGWYEVFPAGHAWDVVRILQDVGIQAAASWYGARAWARFTLGKLIELENEHPDWHRRCVEWGNTKKQLPVFADLLAHAFAGQLSHLGLNGFCGDTPNCAECPLASSCVWNKEIERIKDAPIAGAARETLLVAIQKQSINDIPISDLIAWAFSMKEVEYSVLETFFQKNSLRMMDQKTVYELSQMFPHLPYFGEKMKALLEICKRYSEDKLIPGDQFSCSKDIFDHFRFRLRDLKQELFILVLLDNKHQYLTDVLITKGILNKSLVHPREVYSTAIEQCAAAIVCVHNHPSGDPKASPDDLQITHRLKEVGTVVGIPLLDHIIIGNDRYFSLADQELL